MRWLSSMRVRSLALLPLGTLVIVLVVAFGSLDRSVTELTAQAFQSPIQTPTPPPYPPPPTPGPSPTPPAACPPQTRWGAFEADVEVEGLSAGERAMVQMQPVLEEVTACLAARGVTLPEVAFGNGRHHMRLAEIPDGAYYKLEVQAPPSYFRDPAGYLFQVQGGQIVRRPGFAFQFRLVPPAEQDLPPCWEFVAKPVPSEVHPPNLSGPIEAICRAEVLRDISAPPKQPERPAEGMGIQDIGYHYIGPETTQDNWGVWGRSLVVDPDVRHPAPGSEFVVERVYANNAGYDRWIEMGWGEASWLTDYQFLYEYDTVINQWNILTFPLTPNLSRVEVAVQYNEGRGLWQALFHLGGGNWWLVAERGLGFVTAANGFNRGEVYSPDGNHPFLPRSTFDMGLLRETDGVWRTWDQRYRPMTDVAEDDPYQVDMIELYHRFVIHSPFVYIPLALRDFSP